MATDLAAAWAGGGAPTDAGALRHSLGSFATGVAIITTITPDGRRVGLTANSFSSVSLDPPLILWSLAERSPNRDVFARCQHYAINVLAVDQHALCQRFATPAHADKFAGVACSTGIGGVPLIDEAVAQFECSAHAQHAGGDHLILIGRVEAHRWSKRIPLVFCQGVLQPANLDNPIRSAA